MKLLVDNCVAGAVARRLRADAHDVICVSDRGTDAAELLNGAFVTDDGANARVTPQAARASKP